MEVVMFEDSCLDSWIEIGGGGFGQIYKSRHKRLCCDVAIKLLHYDDGSGSLLLRELTLMRQSSSPYVIHVLGMFRGLAPSGTSKRLGLVMEFMERGCLGSLQKRLCGAPPWPLVFRLAHQVALGINFLHNLRPSLLHLDLKPSNVLLDSYLNAKLTDFGLAKVYLSMSRVSKKSSSTDGGTPSYMPPEAFNLCYNPTKAFDIYSYGILLWSIVTGRQPYEHALTCVVRLRIPQGDRPPVEEIGEQAAGIAGLPRLQDLMEKCWETRPSERPSSHECTLVTEELFKLHSGTINSAVHQIIEILDQTSTEELLAQLQRFQITKTANETYDCCNVPTGKGPVQEVAGCCSGSEEQRFGEPSVPFPVPVSEVESTPRPKSSSVKPIGASLSPSSSSSSSTPTSSTSSSSTDKSLKADYLQNKAQSFQRQMSSPSTLPPPQSPAPRINIHCSNVTGLIVGDNNIMTIHGLQVSERRRHPTAPSRVNLPPQRKGSGRSRKGGDG